jgi:hypothetical protein
LSPTSESNRERVWLQGVGFRLGLSEVTLQLRLADVVKPEGLEPSLRCLKGSCSTELSYGSIGRECWNRTSPCPVSETGDSP